MQIKIFSLPVYSSETVETELNLFLRSHKIFNFDKEFVEDKTNSFWTIWIQYDEYDETSNSEKSKTGQLTEASTEVLNSAIDSVKENETTESNIVLHAQTRLQSLGYDPGPADGIMGNKTKLAIGKYQQSENLEITNSLDKRTLKALNINSSN